jgi:hypothetical protein
MCNEHLYPLRRNTRNLWFTFVYQYSGSKLRSVEETLTCQGKIKSMDMDSKQAKIVNAELKGGYN